MKDNDAMIVLAIVSTLVLISRCMDFGTPVEKTAAATGIVAVGEPWTALGMLVQGNAIWIPAEK